MKSAFILAPDVIAAAYAGSDSAPLELLRMAGSRRLTLLGNRPLLLIYKSVCVAEAAKSSSAVLHQLPAFLDALTTVVRPIRPTYLWHPCMSTLADEMTIKVAVQGGANAIVSFSGKTFASICARKNIRLLNPPEAVEYAK